MYGSKQCFQLICLMSLMCVVLVNCSKKFEHERQKRFLIFPRQAPTRHQFIGGIGIPADLSYESLTIGYVLKAEYYLPSNATVFRENPYLPEYAANDFYNGYYNGSSLNGRSLKETATSPLRWAIYKFISDRLDSYGYNGQECILKAICEANALHFDHHYSVFGEIIHILLSPTTSKDAVSDATIDYFEAEKLGYTNEEACKIYACNLSLLNFISKVLRI